MISRQSFACVAALGVAGALGFAVVSCGGSSSCEDTNSCGGKAGTDGGKGGTAGKGGSGGTGGTGATGGAGGDAGNCDTTKSPSEEACLVTDQFGVFVSPSGDDTAGDGTKKKPYKTLSKAVTQAGSANKRVYACDSGAGFTEKATLDLSALDGAGLYGGFDCTNWSYSAENTAKLTGASTAVLVDSLGTGITVENFDVTATTGTSAGSSTIGMIVAGSKSVILRRVTLTAQNAKDGAAGADGTKGANGEVWGTDQRGKDACSVISTGSQVGGSWANANSCGSEGGVGGTAYKNGSTPGGDGTTGTPQQNVNPPAVNNAGAGAKTAAVNGGTGLQGSNGNPGATGQAPAMSGIFSSNGYSPADGGNGSDGYPGQGGGGGGASMGNGTCVGASGGAGGMGGCPGTKGAAGGGGGASVAIVALQSAVTLDSCTLTAGNGGNGAKGGNAGQGGIGGPGADGGQGGGLGKGGAGGIGGDGGPGGSGSGGSGGPSIGIVWSGTQVTKTGSYSFSKGTGGTKGIGGAVQNVNINKAPDGTDGQSLEEFEQK